MADISKIILPNGNNYNLKDAAAARLNRGIEYIRGTWPSASGTWTGVTEDNSLYDGKIIILFMPYAGNGNATLNLTLSNNTTTGAKNVYYLSTTRMTTQYGQYSHIILIYHSALNIGGTNYQGWWAVGSFPVYDGMVV